MQKPDIGDITRDGRNLVDAWTRGQTEVDRATDRLTSAEESRDAAAMALAKWLLPGDANPGEAIAVWYGTALIQVTNSDPPVVRVRTRGREHDLP